jgi:hypothetical protein
MYSALVENVSSLVVSSTHLASSPDSHFDGRPRCRRRLKTDPVSTPEF